MTFVAYVLSYLVAISFIVIVDYYMLRVMDLDGYKAPFCFSLFLTTVFLAVIIGIWQILAGSDYFWMFFLAAAIFLGPILSRNATILYQTFRKK